MDFLNRNASSQPHSRVTAPGTSAPNLATTAHGNGGSSAEKFAHKFWQPRWLRIASVVLLFSITALVIALVVLLNRGKIASEANVVDKDRYQAVQLSADLMYFGRIADMNSKYVNLVDVYYVNAKKTDDQKEANLELVKFGCEIHGPSDQLIINREQVVYWTNIKDDSTVAKGIKQLQEKNKSGLVCESTQVNGANQPNSQQSTNGSEN